MSNLSVGIVGFPNAGKSTLFNALLKRQVASTAPYAFCTIDPNKGIVPVPDERLPILAKIVQTDKIVPAVVEFVDIAGLVKGAHKGEGLGNQFLSHIKEVDLILFLLRGFDLPDVDRAGSVNPEEDLLSLKTELMLKDLATLEKQSEPRGLVSKEEKTAWDTVKRARALLAEGKYLSDILSKEEKIVLKDKFLLTAKDYLIALNVLEQELVQKDSLVNQYQKLKPIVVSAKIEEELAEMANEEQAEYLNSLGLSESGLQRLIRQAYTKLNLISFLTAGVKEVRAWTIHKNTPAQRAAGVIHTDFMAKFIKVKVVGMDDFVKYRGWKNCAEEGKVRLEGKEYVIKEGEVVEFMIGK